MCRCEAWKFFDQNMSTENLNRLVYWAKWGKKKNWKFCVIWV